MILLPTVFLLLATTIAPWNNNGVIASSIRSPPLTSRAISHPERIGIEVLPRRSSASTLSKRNVPGSVPRGGGGGVQWDDQFFLAFNAHGENVTLSLRPSLHLSCVLFIFLPALPLSLCAFFLLVVALVKGRH